MKLAAALTILLLVLGACGDDDAAETADTTTSTTGDRTTTAPVAGAVELTAQVATSVPAGPVTWELEVRNSADEPTTLTFPSAQQGEALLLDDGETVHRWSDGRSFAQVVQDMTLEPGESFVIELADDLSDVEPGDYTLRLSLQVQDAPAPVEELITVTPAG